MTVKDVTVTITRETAAVTRAGFGMPLILATSKVHDYAEYADLASVAVDFAEGTEEYKIAAAVFGQTPRPEKLAIYGILYESGTDPAADLSAALNTLMLSHNDWYFVLCPEQADADITELSSWVNAQKKLYFASTGNLDLAATLESDRTVLMYHSSPDTYPAEAWVGRCAPEDPGSITWKFKNLNGILPVELTTTEISQLHDDGSNTYLKKLGVNQTSEGLTTSGEYIDIMRSQDWMEARISEAVHFLLFNSKKVPYDNSGIALVVNEVEAVMQRAVNQGIIALDSDGNGIWNVDAPDRSEISANDIANRILPDIDFECTLAGAVHNINIKGVLQL